MLRAGQFLSDLGSSIGGHRFSSALGWGPYCPPGAGRDERIDLLRGFAVVAMVVDHVAGASFFHALTGGNRFYTSAAEAFIFISGLVMGLVYRRLIGRDGLGPSLQRALERAATLYLLAVTLTLFFVPLSELLQVKWAQGTSLSDPAGFVISVLTLHRTYYLVDIPLLYTLLLLVSPLALVMLSQGRTALVLGGSWLLWGLYQLFPAHADVPWAIAGNHLFFFAPWQVFFFTGLALGWHHQELTQRLERFPRRAALAASSFVFAGLVSLYSIVDRLPAIWTGDPERAQSAQLFLLEVVFSKADVRVGRVIASIVVFAFFYLLVTEAWRPISRGLGWLLMPLGQCALYAYAAHVVLAIPLQVLVDALGARGIPAELLSAVVQLSAILGIWLLIKARFLFVNPAKGSARYMWPVAAAAACLLAAGPASSLAMPPPVAAASEPDRHAIRFARAFGTPIPRTSSPGGPLPISAPLVTSIAESREDARRGGGSSSGVAVPGEYVGAIRGTLESASFFSPSLRREMPFFIYLPPGYERGSDRYPVLYMLHGNSGSNEEWLAYGLLNAADEMITSNEIRPLIVVLPQGDYSYWVNLVEGPAYGDYMSIDLTQYIKRTYRVLPGAENTAIGGLSMGGTGALIRAFSDPTVFGVVGAHSPSLPEEGSREFLGRGGEFAQRDPISLAVSEEWLFDLRIWIDVGDEDPWLSRSEALNAVLSERSIPHEWNVYRGDHWGGYWEEHVPDYLWFYNRAFTAGS